MLNPTATGPPEYRKVRGRSVTELSRFRIRPMKPNPYEPTARHDDAPAPWRQFIAWLKGPLPMRREPDGAFRWIADALVTFALWFVGNVVGGVFASVATFLEPIAYPTGLVIGYFPIVLWAHYCRVGRTSASGAAALIVGLLVWFAFREGRNGLTELPAALLIIAVVLPIETVLGKAVLGWLPGSKPRRDENGKQAAAANSAR